MAKQARWRMKTRSLSLLLAGLLAPAWLAAEEAVRPQSVPPGKGGYEQFFRDLWPEDKNPAERMPNDADGNAWKSLWPTVPLAANAAGAYAHAGRLMDMTAAPPGSYNATEKYDGNADAIFRYVELNRKALEYIPVILRQEYYRQPPSVSPGERVPELMSRLGSSQRNLARLVGDAGFAEELKDRPDAAALRYLDCLAMGTEIRNGSGLSGNIVGWAVAQSGLQPLEILLGSTDVSAATLRKVIETCRQARVTHDEIRQTLELDLLERKWLTGDYRLLLRDPETAAILTVAGEAEFDTAFAQLQEYSRALIAELRRRPLEEILAPGFNLAGWQPPDIGKHRDLMEPLVPPELGDHLAQPKKMIITWLDGLGRLEMHLRAVEIRAAILLFRKDQQRLPRELKELVPRYIPDVYLDRYSGNPFRYRTEGDRWQLYSVGPDGQDDGGHSNNAYVLQRDSGPDLIFPDRLPSNKQHRSGINENNR